MKKWKIVVGIACMLIIVMMNAQIGGSSVDEDESITVSVLVDFGDGMVYWADVEITNNTAFNATENACEELDLTLGLNEWGMIAQIGDKINQWPGAWWHLWLWNPTSQAWELSDEGADAVNCNNGDTIGWSYVVGWPGPTPVATPVTKYPWTSFRHDLYHTGCSRDVVAGNDVIWEFVTESWSIGSTPIMAYGKVYVTAWDGLYCLDEDNGSLNWKKPNITGESSPALYNDHIIVGSADGELYCLDMKSGAELWNVMITDEPGFNGITSSPTIHEGRVFIGSFNNSGGTGYLYCLYENNGTVIWKNSTESSIYFSSPAISNGKVFIGTMGLYNSTDYSWSPPYGLYCFNETDGELVWEYSVDNSIGSSPTLLDNKVLFSSKNGGLYCLDENGGFVWEKNIGSSVSSPSIYNERIFVGAGAFGGTGKFYCFDKDGTKLWEYETNGPVQSSPAVADDKLYFATNTENGTLYCLTTGGSLIWEYSIPGRYILSSPSIVNSKLLIGSDGVWGIDGGHIYCFGDKKPIAAFTYTPASPGLNDEITFDASSSSDTSGNITDYNWDFGDGETASGKVVTHKYGGAGEYTVTLTVTDDDGSTDTSQQIVTVEDLKKEEKKPWYLIPGFEIMVLLAGISVALLLTIIQKKGRR